MPHEDLALIVMNGGCRDGVLDERLVPATYAESVQLADGISGPGLAEPSPLWLIPTAGENILIDSGLTDRHVSHANEVFKKRGSRQFYVSRPEDSYDRFLSRHGMRPDDVDVVILTHLHLDHFPNVAAYPNARVLVHDLELLAALAPDPYDAFHWKEFTPYISSVVDRVERIHGDTRVADGIDVLHVGGHSPGQLVVRVRTALGNVLLASDFFNTYQNVDYSWPPGICSSVTEWEENCRRLKLTEDVIVPGHDWAVWRRFPTGTIG
jgi:glyoxylase-like metal-dependent hydrolase (beta-lactamase superfamily II)